MKKKLLSMILAVSMVLGLCACGANEEPSAESSKSTVESSADSKETEGTSAGSETAEKEPVTLKFYTLVTEQADQDAVFDELNKYLQEKLNTTVEWHFLGGEFADKMNVIINSGEEYDACFTSNWSNDYLANVAKEAFVDISGMLSDYPALYESMPEAFWSAATVNGGIYGVPNQQIAARQIAANAPTEFLEGTGYTIEELATADSLLDTVDYLKAAKEQYGAMFGGVDMSQVAYYLGYEMVNSVFSGAAVKYGDQECKVVNLYATEEFKSLCKELAEIYEMGLFDEQNAVDSDYAFSQRSAKRVSLIYTGTMKPGGDIEESNKWGYSMAAGGAGTAYLTTGGIIATLWGISNTSQHPERVLEVIELLATDEYAMNLISYGIEGVHYEFTDDTKTTIRSIDGAGYAPSMSWALGNVFKTYVYEGQPADVWEQTAELNASADVSPLMGYTYSVANVDLETTNVETVVRTYSALLTGTVDVDATIENLLADMEVAGIDTIIEDAQAQIDAFLASK